MKGLLIKLVQFYQKYISPGLTPSCRYHPSCSHYMIDALDKHGTIKGLMMGTARILRCHPFVKGGIDYVPDHFTLKRNPERKVHDGLNEKNRP